MSPRAQRLRSLRFRLPMLLLLYCGVVGTAIYLIVDRTQERRFEQEFEDEQLSRATELQGRTERAAERSELDTAQREFGEMAENEALRAAVFVGPDNRVLLASRRQWRNEVIHLAAVGVPAADRPGVEEAIRQTHQTRRTHSLLTADRQGLVLILPASLPLVRGALDVDRSAVIVLVYDLRLAKAINAFRLRQLFLLIAGAVVLAVFILGVALHFFVTLRLERIQELIGRFAAGEPLDPSASRLSDEIGAIGARFQEMAHTVRREMAERLEATAALRSSEDKFRTVMRSSPIGQALIANDGRILDVNPALCQILGYSENELLQMSVHDLTHADDLSENLDLNAQAVSGMLGSFTIEKRYLHKDGHVVWAQLNAAVVYRDDRPQYFVSQIQDITQRKLAEERITRANRALRAISHCNQALVHATDEKSLLTEICRVIVEDGGFRLAWVAFARADSIVAAAQWGEDRGYIASSLETWQLLRNQPGVLRTFLEKGETRVTKDYATDPFAGEWREEALKRGLRSSATFALKEDGRTFGSLMIYSDQPDAFDENEMRLVSEMAQDLAYGIQALRTRTRRERAEEGLLQSQGRLLIAMDMAQLAPWEFDVQTGEFLFNEKFYGLLRTTSEAEGGMVMPAETYARKFLPAGQAGLVAHEIQRAIESTDPNFSGHLEHPFLRADGTRGYMSVRYAIVKDAAGRTIRTYGANQDITERKEAEESVRATNERYERHEAALAMMTRCQVNSPEQFPDVLRSITEIVGTTLEVQRVALWVRHGHKLFRCEDLFEWPISRHSRGMEIAGDLADDFARTLSQSDILVSHDVWSDKRMDEFTRTFFSNVDVRSFIGVPIRGQGEMVAVFSSSSVGEERRWTPDEQTFFVAVANLMASLMAQVERLGLEAQLRQATKLEGIGQLAGGVAHDFNNVLTVILGKAGQLADDPRMPAELREAADDIIHSGDRAANLTRQLLAFSRRQAMQVRDHDLNGVVRNVARLLDRLLGEDLNLDLMIAAEPIYIRADAGMIDQVLLNLTVNARDAMRDGGRVVIATSMVQLDAQVTNRVSRPSGPYACLRVSDSGSGIPAENLPHIFEPFFTTKDVGKGTGLGLATTYGIVQQHHGWIEVESEVGRGTAFSIYLPSFTQPAAVAVPAETAPVRLPAVNATSGRETILVVEDEDEVRSLIVDALGGFGYRVLQAPSGPVALEQWREHGPTIDLMITDMVMPGGMNGLDLASHVKRDNPGLRIIYISGYLADVSREELSQSEGAAYLAKPFNLPTLARLVRQSLDAVPHIKP